jgi:uncharacterized repeat protein (TIGR01451 family)
MNKITHSTLVIVTALVLATCNLSCGGSNPTENPSVVKLTIQTQNATSSFDQPGEVIIFLYVVTNTGTAPLAGPVMIDDLSKSATCPALNTVGNLNNELDRDETITCSAVYTITQADLAKSSITNGAVATVGGIKSNTDRLELTHGVSQPASSLRLAKTASPQAYDQVGQTITYTYVITNTGTTALGPAQFTVSDNKLSAPLNCGPADIILPTNRSLACFAPYKITQADMGLANITNSATASGAGQTSRPVTVTIANLAAPASQVPLTVQASTKTPGGIVVGPTTRPVSPLVRIFFERAQTTATQVGIVNPKETIHYVVRAVQGQALSLKLTAVTDQVALGVNGPTGLVLKPLDAAPAFSTTVTTAGDYYINLTGLVDTSSSYTLEVGLSPAVGTTPSPVSSGPSQPAQDVFAAEEAALQNLPKASYEFVVPVTLKLNETFQVEFHMSRSLSGPELSTAIVTANALATSTAEAGTLVAPGGPVVRLGGGQVEVTPLMLAELSSENAGAFEIRSLHKNAIQVVDATTTATWLWLITARKEGKQKLIFVISQQAKTNDEAHWHPLETERREVQVNVTLGQRLGSIDWKWILGLLATALLIPAFWRYMDRRKQESAPPPPPPTRQKRTSKKK